MKPDKDKLEELLESLKRGEKMVVKISIKDLTLTGSDAIRYKLFSALKADCKDEKSLVKSLLSIGLLSLNNTFTKLSAESFPLNFLIALKKILKGMDKEEHNGYFKR